MTIMESSVKTYQENYRVNSYETDFKMQMKPFALLNLAQEIAYQHATELGFGYDDLMASNVVWVLSRLYVEIYDNPGWRDRISIETWHKGQDRLFSVRDFIVRKSGGEIAAAITSSWLIINVESRRIHRFERLLKNEDSVDNYVCRRDAIAGTAEKLELSPDAENLDSHKVKYSDLDLNGHVNNAKYIEWAMDRIDADIIKEGILKSFCINFNHEAVAGDHIQFRRHMEHGENGLLHVFIEGVRGDVSVFSVRLDYLMS